MFATIAAIVLVLVGGGATVAAADSARPGDALYGIDTATERVRLVLASEDKKVELKAKFAAERAEEAEELITEAEVATTPTSTSTPAATATDAATSTVSTTPDTTSTSTDDQSDDDEQDEQQEQQEQQERAAKATANAIATLTSVRAELEAKGNATAAAAIAETLSRLEAKVRSSNNIRTRVKIEQDDDGMEVRVETKERKDDDRDEKKRDDRNSSDDSQSLEVEVTVRGTVAYIKYEMGNRKAEYRTTFTSREDIIAKIAADLDVSEDRVGNYLKLKYEDNDRDDDSVDDEDDRSSDNEDSTGNRTTLKEIEVKVYGNQASAKIEMRTGTRSLQLSVTDREAIIAAIAAELGVPENDVAAVIKIEQEDRHDDDSNRSDEDANKDSHDDNRNDDSDDDRTVIDDILSTVIIKKIEVEIEDGVAKVEAKLSNGREEEFRINSTSQVEINAHIAERLGLRVDAVAAAARYKR